MNRVVSLIRLLTLCTVAITAGCTIEDQKAPALTGPSELARSFAVTATPDLIAANGVSQSVIGVVARDAYNQPLANVQLRVDTIDPTTGLIIEKGTLSARQITTNSSGQANVTFTAPTEVVSGVDVNGEVMVRVRPIGTDYSGDLGRVVSIRLVPPTVIFAPGAAIPDFSFNPSAPKPGDLVLFDASASKDLDGSIVSYRWEWGDGATVTRVVPAEDHDYSVAGTYYVKLTVTDNSGNQSFVTKAVTVK
jgi:PKD repeat protein